MTTFTYRDLRRQRVSDALTALQDDLQVLREPLEREQDALQSGDWTVTDRNYLAVAEDWLWATRLLLKDSVNADPVFTALGTTTAISDEQAVAIENIPQGPGGPTSDYMAQVRAAIGDNQAILTELVHAAHHIWLEQPVAKRAYPFDDVGVLLPLRLETLFDAPQSRHNDDPTHWKLSLRVIPDEASICRDNAHVSAGELSTLRTFWQAARQLGAFDPGWLDGDAVGVAWDMFCQQVTPARAAWLVANVLPQVDGDELRVDLPPDMPPDPQPNRVGGLPPQLRVWAVTRDAGGVATRHEIGRLPMQASATISADALQLQLPNKPANKRENIRDAWWVSWETAKAVGLAGEWLLDTGLAPATLEAIYVIGIGDEPPDAHFRAQSDAGELGVLRLGTPTNTVHGAPAADLAADAESWRLVARARIRQRLDPSTKPASTSGSNIEHHLTGSSNSLPVFPGADTPDDTEDSQRMAQALWPALIGHWLTAIWEVSEDAFRMSRWAFPLRDDAIPTPEEIRHVLHRPCKGDERESLAHNFCPEGPLMPLRIGDQPYGLLPVTALSQWQPGDGFSAEQGEQRRVEACMAQALSELRSTWAAAARRNGTVVGASTGRFMDLLSRDALSKRYIQRSFAPVSAWAAPFQLDQAGREQFEAYARKLYDGVARLFGHMPKTLHLANGFWQTNYLPLVQPGRTIYRHQNGEKRARVDLKRFLMLLLDLQETLDIDQIFERWWVLDETAEYQMRVLPDSLLIRLLIHACQISTDWLRNQTGGDIALPVLKAQIESMRAISCELDQPDWNQDERDPETGEPVFLIKLPDERRLQLERALRATLDSFAHRIDPWITGFAWQRLKQHSASARHVHRLGAYGWVDGPFLGAPGPTNAGRLHTPSYNQTLAAIILRDKFLSSARAASANDGGRNPWEMNISSGKVRLAEEIAEEVRLGFHIYEIVGRHVEHVIGTHQKVKALRTSPQYAMRAERLDQNEVCNGIEALKGLLAGDPQFPLQESQRAALLKLHEALDTYGDLLLADGIMQLINRQADRAAETMDAAAGFTRPPSFEFIRTPPSGYQLESLVMAVVPYVSVSTVPDDGGPIRLADPSLAAFVDDRLGDGWTWTATNLDDNTQLGAVTLKELGLEPLDTLALPVEFLGELARRKLNRPLVYISEGHAREWVVKDAEGNPLGSVSLVDLGTRPTELAALDQTALYDKIRTQIGAAVDAVVEEIKPDDLRLWIAADEDNALLGMATVATLGITPQEASANQSELHLRIRQTLGLAQVCIDPPPQHQLAQHLAAALGNRPAAGRDVTQDASTQQAVDADIYVELTHRYSALHSACVNLIAGLRAAGNDAARTVLLRRALGWGVTSISKRADREALFAALCGTVASASASHLADVAEATAKALEDRLGGAPEPAKLAARARIGAQLHDHDQRKREQQPDGIPTLAQAIANLAAPQGKLAILACWSRKTLLGSTQLVVQHDEPALDDSWLTVVATVRPPLARLEALQLALADPLVAWSSSPADPWRTGKANVVKANLKKRSEASTLQMSLNERFVAAYGSTNAWAGDHVAVGLIDSFSEAIPMPHRSTMAAFGFNAPAARPPQAILLAVPPLVRQRLDDDLVQQIVEQTRELAHARNAHVEDLGDLQALAPTLWFQSSGPNRVRLEPYPLFS
ncbi:hypothetical protein HFK74_19480|uniref:hypothetical protein n=1 Tax=Pseudomonas sp. SbOxS1 TaxID=2723884 RepID=UPI0015D2E3F9|nr:hypothetical protein [Pseudomonas sp. SbOxS1]NYU04879.1 hypothetical protein [Pseudomonas sp. SbOxS1]